MRTYCFFMRKQVLSNTEEIFPELAQTFHKSFLEKKGKIINKYTNYSFCGNNVAQYKTFVRKKQKQRGIFER